MCTSARLGVLALGGSLPTVALLCGTTPSVRVATIVKKAVIDPKVHIWARVKMFIGVGDPKAHEEGVTTGQILAHEMLHRDDFRVFVKGELVSLAMAEEAKVFSSKLACEMDCNVFEFGTSGILAKLFEAYRTWSSSD